MILVRMANHNYRNEIIDMIKSFYGNRPMEFLEDDQLALNLTQDKIKITVEIIRKNDIKVCLSKYYSMGSCFTEEEEITIENSQRDYHEREKQMKRAVKISLFKLLTKVTGKTLPWGILTGIRPVKIVHSLLDRGLDYEDILKELKNKYFVTDNRGELSLNIAKRERVFLKNPNKKLVSIYVGIPFCPSRCHYCSFTSNDIKRYKNFVAPYIKAVKKEIKIISGFLKKKGVKVQSIYIGGGTPTSLEIDELSEIIDCINEFWPEPWEFTCESGRPDTIEERKLIGIKKRGINRISINPQTMNDETLKKIGRQHSSQEIIEKFNLARSLGFNNINMDIILGLEGEGLNHLRKTMNEVIDLDPESITVHILSIKRASLYDRFELNMGLDSNIVTEMSTYTKDIIKRQGMFPYYLYRQKHMAANFENIGYCKPGFECIYNIQTMGEEQSIISFGANAATKIIFTEEDRIEKQYNIKDLRLYIERIDEQINKKLNLLYELYGE